MAIKALAICIAALGIHSPVLAFNSTCYSPPYQGGGPEGHVAPEDTPCTPNTDDEVARPCCGYSNGAICLSNGLCFVPQNNSMLQGSCTDPSWSSPGCPSSNCVDANLQFCQTAPEDVPEPGDSGGLWFCRTSSQSCTDGVFTFGIQQGYFADFRNGSFTSSAGATVTKSVPASTSADVTNNAKTVTETLRPTLEPSYPSSTPEPSGPSCTGGDTTLSRGAIAGVAIGGFCAGLIASGAGVLKSRRRRGGKHQVVQTTVERKDDMQRPLEGGPIPELPDNRRPLPELPADRRSGAELH